MDAFMQYINGLYAYVRLCQLLLKASARSMRGFPKLVWHWAVIIAEVFNLPEPHGHSVIQQWAMFCITEKFSYIP